MALINGAMDNVEAWAEYEYSLAHVQGLMSYTREEMANFESQAYDTARATRYTAAETLDAYWELLSAGYAEREVLNLLEPTMQAAVIGQMELKDSADMVTSAMKAFQIPAEEAGGVVDVLTAGVRLSKIHFDEYAQAFGTIGSSASAANATLEETVALFGIMRSAGMSGSKAAMMVKMMYTHLMGLSEGNRELMHSLGVYTIDAVSGQMRPMRDIIADLFASLPELPDLTGMNFEQIDAMSDEMLERIFYGEERLKAFADIFGLRAVAGMYAMGNAQIDLNGEILNGLDAYSAIVGVLENSQGYAEDYYGTLMETYSEKQRVIASIIDLLKVQLGGALGSTLIPVLDFIIKALQTVSQFLQDYPQIAAALAWVGAIGGVILVVGGTILLIAGLASAIAFMGPMIGAVAILLAKVGLIAALIAGVAALVILKWEAIKQFFGTMADWATARFGNTFKMIQQVAQGMWVYLKGFWETVVKPIFAAVVVAIGAIVATLSVVIGIVASILRTFMAITEAVGAFFTALETGNWSAFLEEIDRIWAQLKIDIGEIGTLFLTTIVAAIRDIPNQLIQGASVRGGSGETLFGGTGAFLEGVGTAAGRAAWLGLMPQFASGTTQVQQDGPVFVHEGEEITQRGRSNSSKPSIGQVTFNVHGVQDPEGFMNRAYAQLQRLMANDMQMTVRP
jgi:TP901 family phage tail tape measure protein